MREGFQGRIGQEEQDPYERTRTEDEMRAGCVKYAGSKVQGVMCRDYPVSVSYLLLLINADGNIKVQGPVKCT